MKIKLENMANRFDLFQRANYHGFDSLTKEEQLIVADTPDENLSMLQWIDLRFILELIVQNGPPVIG